MPFKINESGYGDATNSLNKYEEGNQLVWGPDTLQVEKSNKKCVDMINGVTNYNLSEGTVRRDLQEEAKAVEKILEILAAGNGKIKTAVYSNGGNGGKELSKQERNELMKHGAKTKYLVMELNGIVILESLGQYGNATYIGKDTTDLNKKMKEGRKAVIKDGTAYRIIHEENEGKYDYEHIIKILNMVKDHPNEVMKALEETSRDGIKLGTLIEKMPRDGITEDECIRTAGKEIQKRKIKVREVIRSDKLPYKRIPIIENGIGRG